MVPDKWLDDLMNVCKTKDYSKAEEFVDQFILEAYATSQVILFCYLLLFVQIIKILHFTLKQFLQVIEQLSEKIIYSNELTDQQKALIADRLGVRV